MAKRSATIAASGLATCVCAILAGCTSMIDPHVQHQEVVEAKNAIGTVLQEQVQAWNRGDIDDYMAAYRNSEFLTVSSAGQTARGWQVAYDRFRAEFPTPKRMGRLEFSEVVVRLLDDPRSRRETAYVLGRWYVHRNPEPVGGDFTLILRKFGRGGWQIVHEHRSVDPQALAP